MEANLFLLIGSGVRRVGKLRFVRKRVVLQPGQQALGRRADHIQLWIVDVGVDKARRDDAAGLKASYDNCAGWMQMLCALKVWAERGINIREGMFR